MIYRVASTSTNPSGPVAFRKVALLIKCKQASVQSRRSAPGESRLLYYLRIATTLVLFTPLTADPTTSAQESRATPDFGCVHR